MTGWVIHCPACGFGHKFNAAEYPNPLNGAKWTFSGTLEWPTFAPSMLIKYQLRPGEDYVCHSFVRDGKIEFLSDCTHAMAGQTVELGEA